MSLRAAKKFLALAIVAACVVGLQATTVLGASSTWIQSAPGVYSWDTNAATNWQGGNPADGQGTTADFNTLNMTGDITVNSDVTSHVIGNMIFGDTDTSSGGNWTLGGTNSLSLDNGGSGALTITVNALAAGKVVTLANPMFGGAGLIKAGSGTLIISNTGNGISGGITISGGILQGSFASIGSNDFLDNASLVFDQPIAAAYGNTISGSGSLTKIGGGVLTLNNTQAYSGATLVNGGGLIASGSLASTSLTMGGGTLTLAFGGGNPVNFTGGTTVNGPSSLVATAVTGTAALGAITRTSGGALNFTLSASGGTITTTSANVAGTGILGGWATVGGNDYAVSAGDGVNPGAISALATYTNDTWAANNNTKITQQTSSQSGATTNTLRIGGDSDSASVTFTAATGVNTITVSSNAGLQVGALVTAAAGIPANTRITAINGTTVTISNNTNAAVAAAAPLTFGTLGTATVNLSGANTITGGGILSNSFSPAVTFNGGSLQGAAGGGDVIFHQFSTGAVTVNSTIGDNGGATGVVKNGTGTVILAANNTYTGNTSIGGGTLQVGNGGSTGSINMAGNILNNGTLSFNRSGSLNITKQISGGGGTTISGGLAMTLDHTAAAAPASNLLTTGAFTMTGGASLNVVGKANTINSQTFASSTFGNGLSTITVANGSGGTATVNLGALSAQIGSAARFTGPLTGDAAGSPVAATGFLNTNAAGTGGGNALGTTNIQGLAGQGWATVGLYDYAGTVPDPVQTGVFNIVGGSQIGSFYTTTYPNATASNVNFDVTANLVIANGGAQKATGTMRFNTPAATTVTSGNSNLITNQAFLITPNMGANNANFNLSGGGSGQWQVVRSTTAGAQEGLVWQNNTLGFFNIGIQIVDGRSGTTNPTDIVKAGPGTMVVSNSTNVFTGGLRLLEGATLIPSSGGNGALGVGTISVASSSTASPNVTLAAAAPATLTVGAGFLGQVITAISGTAVTLNGNANQNIAAATNVSFLTPTFLNGGTMVGSGGSFALNTGGASPVHRPISLQAKGGTLAATTGTRLTVSGLVSNGTNGAGALVIGTGAIAGTGAGTANTTALTGNGEVALSGANTYTGGTTVNFGNLLVGNSSGSATGTGSITVNSGAGFGGNGTASGAVTFNSGGHLTPGASGTNSGIGTVNAGGISLLSGSVYDVDMSAGSNDLAVSNNGLSVASGTSVNLFQAGTTNTFGLNGTFTLFSVPTGSIPTPAQLQSNLTIANPATDGIYTWGVSGTNVTLQITGLAISSTWNVNGGGLWGTPGNWNPPVVPGNPGDSAIFGSVVTSGTAHITLDGDRTVGSVSFNDAAASYSIDPGTPVGNLILNNKTASAQLSDANGNHSITANIVLQNDLIASVTNAADTLTISGNISGAKNLTATGGSGKLLLTGTNSYVDTTIGNGMTLQVGSGAATGTLGSGVIANDGTLSINVTGATSLNQLTGSGKLVQAGTGTTTLSSATNSGTWSTTVNAGTLVVGTGSSLGSGAITMSGGLLDLNGFSPSVISLNATGGTIDNVTAGGTPLITVNLTGNANYGGTISNTTGTVALTKTGPGNLTLSGTGTYDGNTTITNGSITITSSTAVKAGSTIDVQANTGLLLGNVTVGANILLTLPQNTSVQMFDVNPGSHATITGNITEAGNTGNAQTRFNAGNDPTTTDLTITGNITTSTGITDLERGSFIFAGNSNFTATGGNGIWFGRNNGSTLSELVKDNAQITAQSITLSQNGTGITVANNTFTLQGNAIVSANGTTTAQGTFDLSVGTASTVNLNGGTLRVGSIIHTAGTTTVTFNGTQVIAVEPASPVTPPPFNFFSPAAATVANIQVGGMKVNSNGFDLLMNQALTHDPALDTVTPTLDGGFTKSGAGTLFMQGQSNYTGPTTITGGTLALQGGELIDQTSKVILSDGKLDSQGNNQTFNTAALKVSGSSGIDMGNGNSVIRFQDSSGEAWTPSTAGSELRVSNWTSGSDHLVFNTNNGAVAGLLASQATQSHIAGFRGTAILQAFDSNGKELVPAPGAIQLVRGDFNGNGTRESADLPLLEQALTDLAGYQSSYAGPGGALASYELPDVIDVNNDGVFNNLDLQTEIFALITGTLPGPTPGPAPGGAAPVPEPSTMLLAGLAAMGLGVLARKRRQGGRSEC